MKIKPIKESVKIIIICFYLIVLINPLLFSEDMKSIYAEFIRNYRKGNSTEALKGEIYFKMQGDIVFRISSPISQWMVFKNNRITIYYPEEKKALCFTNMNLFEIPFFKSFICLVKDDFGLSDMGFTLSNHRVEGNTLFTIWTAPKKLVRSIGEIVLGMKDKKIISFVLKDKSHKIISSTEYTNHVSYGTKYFPAEVITTYDTSEGRVTESISYSNITFNPENTKAITSFKLPEDIEVSDIK